MLNLCCFSPQEKDDLERKKAEEKMSTCHIYNLNPDPMLTGMIVHLLKEGIFIFVIHQ